MPPPPLPKGLRPAYWSVLDLPRGASVMPAIRSSDGEAWIASWDGIGLYEGNNKIPSYQTVTFHLTTHRLLLVPDPEESAPPALHAPLSAVRQTESYAGFMRSSAKITLFLGAVPVPASSPRSSLQISTHITASGVQDSTKRDSGSPLTPTPALSVPTQAVSAPSQSNTWTCGVCAFSNTLPPGTILTPATKCALCGVAYAMSKSMSPPVTRSGTPAAPSPTQATSQAQAQAQAQTLLQVATEAPSRAAPSSSPTTGTEPGQSAAPEDVQIACPACTFLNHRSMTYCEICGTLLPRPSRRRVEGDSGAGTGVVAGGNGTLGGVGGGTATTAGAGTGTRTDSAPPETHDVVRLSFRRGGQAEAYKRLKGVLSDKVWERVAAGPNGAIGRDGEEVQRGGGIDAIMKSISLDAKVHDEGMQDAFKDLEVLMIRAGEMVRLAQSLSAKVAASSQGATDEEATLVQSSLVRLGLPAPALTQDMVRDERAYLEGLARELGGLLTGRSAGSRGILPAPPGQKDSDAATPGMMLEPGNGVIGLDTVWAVWMRARGVALLMPSMLAQVLPLIPGHTNPPIRSLTLASGLTVLYAPLYAPHVLLGRIVARLTPSTEGGSGTNGDGDNELNDGDGAEQGMSIMEIAAVEGLAVGLASELVESVAARPPRGVMGIVRDDQAGPGDGGTKWYRDLISSWPLGQVGVTG